MIHIKNSFETHKKRLINQSKEDAAKAVQQLKEDAANVYKVKFKALKEELSQLYEDAHDINANITDILSSQT